MAPRPTTASNTLRLQFGDVAVASLITVPAGRVAPQAALPALRKLVNDVVAACEENERSRGRSITCHKGCGACCRQLVPISRTEAYDILEVIRSLPAARRQEVEKRFAAVEQRLAETALAAKLLDPGLRTTGDDRALSLDYFALGLACPFLEEEACSIHEHRPLACREYLVTSAAAHCAHPQQHGATPVQVPKLSAAARGLDADDDVEPMARWLPLALALAWTRRQRAPTKRRTGPEWIARFLARLGAPPRGIAP